MRAEVLSTEERQRFLQVLRRADQAFGDCALLLRGVYSDALSDAERLERLAALDLSGLDDPRAIADGYRAALTESIPAAPVNFHLRVSETTRRYAPFFLWYERRRLNRRFQTLEKYALSFPNLGNEGAPLSNLLHNLRAFGPAGLFGGLAHPRLRLYAALPLLLSPQANREIIGRLLHTRQTRFEALCETFTALQRKFG
jgi:hypothetical protein